VQLGSTALMAPARLTVPVAVAQTLVSGCRHLRSMDGCRLVSEKSFEQDPWEAEVVCQTFGSEVEAALSDDWLPSAPEMAASCLAMNHSMVLVREVPEFPRHQTCLEDLPHFPALAPVLLGECLNVTVAAGVELSIHHVTVAAGVELSIHHDQFRSVPIWA